MIPCPRTRLLRIAAALVTLCLAAAGPASRPATATPGPRTEAGTVPGASPALPRARPEHVTSELVLIETYVNDLKGRPVRGLGPEDFVLMIDGKVAPIASIEFRELGAGAEGGASPDDSGAGETPSVAVPQGPPRRFLLFFEDDTSSPFGLTAARKAAAELIASRLLPTDQVALVEHGRGLRLVCDFTSDQAVLLSRLQVSLRDRSRASGFAAELQDREAEMRRVAGEKSMFGFLLQTYAFQDAQRYQRTLSALRTTIDALAPWPGYKALIFLGDGIPDNPGRYYIERLRDALRGQALRDLVASARRADLSFEMKALIDAAGAAGVTVHTIATAGLLVDPEAGRPPQAGRGRIAGYGGSASATLADSVRADSLKTIAFNTGGVSSHSNDALRGLAEAEASSRAYYILGYAPEGPPDGRAHTVQVRVKGITAEVRWRRGFTRLSPEEARARAVQAAHLLPELYATGALDLILIPGPAEGPGRMADLVLYLPPGQVLFLPEEGRAVARLEIGLTILDGSGRETLRLARSARIAAPTDDGDQAATGINLVHRLRLPDAAQSVTAVIDDRGAHSLVAARLQVPAARAGDHPVAGLSIYSRSDASLWVEIAGSEAGAAGSEETPRARVGPALKSTFAVGEPLLCGFRAPGGSTATELPLRVVLLSGERQVARVDVEPGTATAEGIVKQSLPVEGLPPGDYRLRIQEVGPAGPAEIGALPFRLAPRQGMAPAASGSGGR